MRPEEYLGLRWSDVDIVKQTVTVQRTLVWRRQKVGWYFGEPKTNKSRRTIPLTEKLVKDLTKLRRKQNERRLKLGSKWTGLNVVCITPPRRGIVPVERFQKRSLLAKTCKELFPNDYYSRLSKAHLFDSRNVQSSSDLTDDPLEVGQVAQA
jgi:integrase